MTNKSTRPHFKMELPPQVEFALDRLTQRGFEAYVVGGCVRDAIMGVMPGDHDMTTSATPDQIMACFDDQRVIPTGIKHGTVTVLIDGLPLEITTYRHDGAYTDHRRPDSVTFSTRLEDDLCRRDFTVNAMAYNHKTGLVDLYYGVDDIECGFIRCVGEPADRFKEDALRMLRAVRFASRLGFNIEFGTEQAIHELYDDIGYVAMERIYAEVSKTFTNFIDDTPIMRCSDLMIRSLGLDGWDSAKWHRAVRRLKFVRSEAGMRFSALLLDHDDPRSELRFIKAPNEVIDRACAAINCARMGSPKDRTELKRRMNAHGAQAVGDGLELGSADALARIDMAALRGVVAAQRELEDIIASGECHSIAMLAINGRDLMSLGINGKAVGEALNAAFEAVITSIVPNEREALLNYATDELS